MATQLCNRKTFVALKFVSTKVGIRLVMAVWGYLENAIAMLLHAFDISGFN